MKLLAALALSTLTACTSVAVPQDRPVGSPPPASPERQFSIVLGQRSLDQGDWSPVDDQGVLGFEYAQDSTSEYIGWEVGLTGSRDENSSVSGSTGEIYGGVRKTFGKESVRPYIGGGLAFIHAQTEVLGLSDDDSSLAGYAHCGLQFLVSPTFFLGIDLRFLFGSDLSMAGFNGDADYTQVAMSFGWRF